MRFFAFLLLAGCTSSSSSGTLRNRGYVTVDSQAYTVSGQRYGSGSAVANFLREQTDPFVGCKKKTIGNCTAHYECMPVLGQPAGDGGAAPYASAGDIGITGLGADIVLSIMDSGMFAGQYSSYQQYTPMFSGGESIGISNGGGEVPGFMAAVIAPAQPTITAPDAINRPATVPQGQDLNFTWSNGTVGELVITLSQTLATGAPGLECRWLAAGGSGSVPSAALNLLIVGNANLTLGIMNETDLTAADWQVQLAATTTPLQMDGTAYAYGSVVVQ